MDNAKIVSVLNGLIEISRDGAEGFRTCAEDVDDAALKLYFRNRAESCEKAIHELNTEVRRHGGDPDPDGTLTGTLHRAWVNLRTAIISQDNLTVLEECERGEGSLREGHRARHVDEQVRPGHDLPAPGRSAAGRTATHLADRERHHLPLPGRRRRWRIR